MKNRDHERACDRVSALFPQRWLRRYVGRKLRTDPAFPAAFDLFTQNDAPITDIGCGVGLLAAYLRERKCRQPITGIDRDPRKIALAREIAARARYRDVNFRERDVTQGAPEFGSNIALVDVLHYLPSDQQLSLLIEIAQHLPTGGIVAIRDAPRACSARFLFTYAGEKFAQAISWNVAAPLNFPTRRSLHQAFVPSEFDAQSRPLWGRTPFYNHLFIFRRRSCVTASVPE